MNGIDFFVDTNILIYVLEGNPAVSGIKHCSLAVSAISEIELLGKKDITPQETRAIRNLLKDCEIININDEIKEIAISLKQKQIIKIPDAIIAATAKSFDLPLITADKDFKKIENIDIILLDIQNS